QRTSIRRNHVLLWLRIIYAFVSVWINKFITMGSMQDLQKLLRQKDIKIRELQREIQVRDDKIVELSSQLDKYQSILPTQAPAIAGPRKQRAQGISAEPAAQRSLESLRQQPLKKYSKSQR
ncbi:unnamed protein product, partial [Owenia fusiformis]